VSTTRGAPACTNSRPAGCDRRRNRALSCPSATYGICERNDNRGIDFLTADKVAETLGIEKTAMIRVGAGLRYALALEIEDGDLVWVGHDVLNQQLPRQGGRKETRQGLPGWWGWIPLYGMPPTQPLAYTKTAMNPFASRFTQRHRAYSPGHSQASITNPNFPGGRRGISWVPSRIRSARHAGGPYSATMRISGARQL
jgi:hypothetical protein